MFNVVEPEPGRYPKAIECSWSPVVASTEELTAFCAWTTPAPARRTL